MVFFFYKLKVWGNPVKHLAPFFQQPLLPSCVCLTLVIFAILPTFSLLLSRLLSQPLMLLLRLTEGAGDGWHSFF